MGDLGLLVDSMFKSLDCKSHNCGTCPEQSFVGENQLKCRNVEIVETGLLRSDMVISSVEDDLNALMIKEIENLHFKENICYPTSNKMISQISSPNTTELLNLSKHAKTSCSEVLQCRTTIFVEAEPSNIELGCMSFSSVQNVTEGGVPFQAPSKPVSALKGTRARQGKPLDQSMCVKWAGDVYDPPVTSSSHTVKAHLRHHRSAKARKEHCKHKHSKSRPNASSSGGRGSSHRGGGSAGISDPRLSRLQALPSISLQAGFGRLKMQQVVEESNCGSSLHAKPWPFSLPVTEAS